MRTKKRYNIMLSPATANKLDEIARLYHISRSCLISDIISEWLLKDCNSINLRMSEAALFDELQKEFL